MYVGILKISLKKYATEDKQHLYPLATRLLHIQHHLVWSKLVGKKLFNGKKVIIRCFHVFYHNLRLLSPNKYAEIALSR